MGKYSDIKWQNDGPPSLLPEVLDYYIANGYREREIPLNADTAKEICIKLDELSELGLIESIPKNDAYSLNDLIVSREEIELCSRELKLELSGVFNVAESKG